MAPTSRLYSTPDEDARDFDYVPERTWSTIDRVLIDDTDSMMDLVASRHEELDHCGSGSDGRFMECSGSYPAGS